MRIFCPRQPDGERRVALTPDVVAKLVDAGHAVHVESGAGLHAGFPDAAYADAGAEVGTASATADITVTVVDPGGAPAGAILGLLDPFVATDRMTELAAAGTTVFAFEAVPRTTRAQVVDALSSQATAAGYQAVLVGAEASDRFFPMLTTAAGTIRPSKVVVLGAGVAGLQAIATARRLGAVVSGFDVRAAAAEQVESLGARFITLDDEPGDASDAGGYAKQLADDAQQRLIDGLRPHVADADVVISTAAIPGRPAPKLIDDAGLGAMRAGAVVVDLAAATGGNTTRTVAGERVVHDGVLLIGDTRLVGGVAADASRMYAKNVASFLELLAGDEGAYAPDWDDDIIAESCIARDGRLVHPRLAPPSPTPEPLTTTEPT
jgi:NAD(P) transhydrogenase subunit alpha